MLFRAGSSPAASTKIRVLVVALMAKVVDATDSKSVSFGSVGSIPAEGTVLHVSMP